ncbi:hypothetical protein [Aurantibacillus circumpalustris]|uniref:hypothetical protein n=1 Tax=Aurantibacillus circumpalustris TaxID=3036359 RepID=UPI00295BEFA6|nr:hypothetical protein [Aurantibacillus circumpalustris]
MKPVLAPIVFFAYNRPNHTRQALESLMKNDLAKDSDLYIFADGPKKSASKEQLANLNATRKILKEKQWCKNVYITELDDNMGVDAITIMAVTKLIDTFGKTIVLEDDLLTSKGFLTYMNEALELYKNDDEVMHVAGYVFPIKKEGPGTFFIYGGTSPWGWATWKRAWDNFEPDYKTLYSEIGKKSSSVKQFNFNNTYPYFDMLKSCADDKNPWDIRWYAAVFLKGAYGLWPTASLVQNIGHDSSGEHCGSTNQFYHEELAQDIPVKRIQVKEDSEQRKKISVFLKSLDTTSLSARIKNKIKLGVFRKKA